MATYLPLAYPWHVQLVTSLVSRCAFFVSCFSETCGTFASKNTFYACCVDATLSSMLCFAGCEPVGYRVSRRISSLAST